MTYETVRSGETSSARRSLIRSANGLARGDKWRLNEVLVSIADEKHWLWRAVDQNELHHFRLGVGEA